MVNFHSKGHRSGNSDPTCCAVQPKTNTNGPLNPAGGQDWLPLVTPPAQTHGMLILPPSPYHQSPSFKISY